MMRVLRITTPLKDKERNAEIDRIIKSLKVFKGVEYTAPSWYYEYCVAVSTLDLTTAECLKIMRQRMEGNGKAWLDGALARTIKQYTDDIYIMPSLMGQFRDQYMGESTATALRDKLLTMKLTDTGLNLTELKSHYESFATTMTNHRVCDPTMTEATYKQMYVDNMPARIKMFMGMSYQSCENVDKVFQIAEKAVNSLPKLQALNLNEMEVTYVPVAAYPNTGRDKSKNTKPQLTPQELNTKYNMEKVTCYHCGKTKHFATQCQLMLAGTPQTTAGATAYADYCRRFGHVITYTDSLKKWMAKFGDNANVPASHAVPSPNTTTNSRQKSRKPRETEEIAPTVVEDSEDE
jgi:hypothetical protein